MAGSAKRVIPQYQRAQEAVLEILRTQHLQAGAKVPSERELALRFGLSRMTVRRGVEDLVRRGVLVRAGTAGTRVANVSVMRVMDTLHAYSMTDMVKGSGAQPGSRLLVFAPGPASRDLAGRLAISPGDEVITIRRVRTADGVPFCVETSILPAARVPGLVGQDLAQNASLYALLRERYGIVPEGRDSEISLCPVTEEDAALLGIEAGINVLLYRSLVRDTTGVPVEMTSSVSHPQRVVFRSQSAQLKL
jgi:GntR family transcriptional regulator